MPEGESGSPARGRRDSPLACTAEHRGGVVLFVYQPLRSMACNSPEARISDSVSRCSAASLSSDESAVPLAVLVDRAERNCPEIREVLARYDAAAVVSAVGRDLPKQPASVPPTYFPEFGMRELSPEELALGYASG